MTAHSINGSRSSSSSDAGSVVPGKVLVVEDEKHIARFLEFVLKKAGYAVIVSHVGRSAAQIVQEQHPQALILDLMLPDLSGFEVLEQINEEGLREVLSILVLTASPAERVANRALRDSVDAVCLKPIAPSTLVSTLKEMGVYPSPEGTDQR